MRFRIFVILSIILSLGLAIFILPVFDSVKLDPDQKRKVLKEFIKEVYSDEHGMIGTELVIDKFSHRIHNENYGWVYDNYIVLVDSNGKFMIMFPAFSTGSDNFPYLRADGAVHYRKAYEVFSIINASSLGDLKLLKFEHSNNRIKALSGPEDA